MSAPAPLPQRSKQDLVQCATWLAATIGPFDPADLVGHLTQEPDERRKLSVALAPLCSEVSVGETVLWTLDADPRRQALTEMQKEGVFSKPGLPPFIENLPVAPADRFGRYLRDALAGKVNPEAGDREDIDAQYSAYEFVGRARAGNAPEQVRDSAGMVEQRAQRIAADERLAQSVGPVFVGRVAESAALHEFALNGVVSNPAFSATPPPQAHVSPMVIVSGISGAGKSALISKLVRELRQESSPVAATVILDFDRPTVSSLDRVQLSMEVIRQIALSQPQLATPLTELRSTALTEFSDVELASASDEANFRRDLRALYSIHQRLQKILMGASLMGQPVVIILDTFEEVLMLGDSFTGAIYGWLEELRSVAGLSRLRVIVSGRAVLPDHDEEPVPGEPTTTPYPNVVAQIRLGDLLPDEAVELLGLRGVEATLAGKLIGQFGCNPLVLRLLSDYVAQKGTRAADDLVRDKKSRKQYSADIAQRILYSRILGRIRNEPAVKALASPGLIVRVVTPGVIREVLAAPCGLGKINETRAAELFDKLASQIWLVRRIGPRAVTHRRDLRTLMLPLAVEPKREARKAESGAKKKRQANPLPKQIRQIHRNALAYYRREQDPDVSESARRNEEIYHQLFLEPERALARPDLKAALPNLAVDIEDFPVEPRAELKRRLGRSLTVEESNALQVAQNSDYERVVSSLKTRNTGRSAPASQTAFQAGNTTSARVVGQDDDSSPLAAVGPSGTPPPLAATATPPIIDAFADARFEDIARISHQIFDLLLTRVTSKDGVGGLQPDMSNHVSWIAALSTLVMKPSDDCTALTKQWLETFCDRADQNWRWLRLRKLEDRSQLAAQHYVTAIAILLNRGRALDPGVRRLVERIGKESGLSVEITSTIALRIFQLFVTVAHDVPIELRPSAVNLSVLQYFAGLLNPAFAQSRDASMHSAQRAWQRLIKAASLPTALKVFLGNDPSSIETTDLASVERSVGEQRLDMYDWESPLSHKPSRGGEREGCVNWVHLRGTAPDLQAPALSALRERFGDRAQATQLLKSLDQASKWWPGDLALDDTNPNAQLSDAHLTTLCHYADRFAMFPLLFQAAEKGTISERVGRVYSVYAAILAMTRDSEAGELERES